MLNKFKPARGSFAETALQVAAFVVVVFLVSFLIVVFITPLIPRDSTDPEGSRSGLGLRVDAATGCHYLSSGSSGITPRLRADGSHWCDPVVSPQVQK